MSTAIKSNRIQCLALAPLALLLAAVLSSANICFAQGWTIETLPSYQSSYPYEIYPQDLTNSSRVLAYINSYNQSGNGLFHPRMISSGSLLPFGPPEVFHTNGSQLNSIFAEDLNSSNLAIATASNPEISGSDSAFLITQGSSINLHTQLQAALGQTILQSRGLAISDSGLAAGEFITDALRSSFIYDSGAVAVIPRPQGESYGWFGPRSINNSGMIAGRYNNRAAIYTHHGSFSTNYLPLPPGLGPNSAALDINNQGATVGWAVTGSFRTNALLWLGNIVHDLGAQCPRDGLYSGASSAQSINNHAAVTYIVGDCNNSAVVWFGSMAAGFQMVHLSDILPPNSGWDRLESARRVNDLGQILGQGFRTGQSGRFTFLMSPPNLIGPTASPTAAMTPTQTGTPAAGTPTPTAPPGATATQTLTPTPSIPPQQTLTPAATFTATPIATAPGPEATPTHTPAFTPAAPPGDVLTPISATPPQTDPDSGPRADIAAMIKDAKKLLRIASKDPVQLRPLSVRDRKKNRIIRMSRKKLLSIAAELNRLANDGIGLQSAHTKSLTSAIKNKAWRKARRVLTQMEAE